MTDNPHLAGPGDTGPARSHSTDPARPATGGPPASSPTPPGNEDQERVVIRDRRKVDLASGVARPVASPDSHEPRRPGKGPAVGRASVPTRPAPAASADAGDSAKADAVASDPVSADRAPTTGSGSAASAEEAPAGTGAPGKSAAEGPAAKGTEEEPGDREPDTDSTPAVSAPGPGAELEALRAELDERTGDLLRVSAEYANYRKRVDRDRTLAAEQATGAVLIDLLPVLDDLDRAREHGDLVGPFGAVAEKLIAALGKYGLTGFGAKGDPFDPTQHEAVMHLTSTDVTEPTCADVMRRGYLLGERLLRAALVAVAAPE